MSDYQKAFVDILMQSLEGASDISEAESNLDGNQTNNENDNEQCEFAKVEFRIVGKTASVKTIGGVRDIVEQIKGNLNEHFDSVDIDIDVTVY